MLPARQTGAASPLEELQQSDEGTHAMKNISVAMAMAEQPKHEDPRPMSSA